MILPQVDSLPQFTMSAGADINPRVREAFKARYPEASVYGSAFPAHLEEQSMANQVQTRWIDATSETGKMAIFIAEPTGSGPYPGIAYCHALPGINQQHRSMAERIAAEGYVVAIPDLFNRISYRTEFRLPDERDRAQAARQSLTYFGLAVDTRLALNALREHERVDPTRLGVVGYCIGGTVAYLAATVHRDVRAAAVMYGVGLVNPEITPAVPVRCLDLAGWVDCPMLWLSARGDELVPPAEVGTIAERMGSLGKDFDWHIFDDPDVGHGFFEEDIPRFYNAAAAEWGWSLKLDFLKRHLVEPAG